eukprot:COSAG01_NODE_53098_length_341_cov_1.471074_1_plen_102_part_01
MPHSNSSEWATRRQSRGGGKVGESKSYPTREIELAPGVTLKPIDWQQSEALLASWQGELELVVPQPTKSSSQKPRQTFISNDSSCSPVGDRLMDVMKSPAFG